RSGIGTGGSKKVISSSVAINNSDKVYVTGYFNSSTVNFGSLILNNAGLYNIFVTAYDSSGNIEWAKASACLKNAYPWTIVADKCENCSSSLPPCTNIFVSGSITGSDFKFDAITLPLPTNGSDNSFIIDLNYWGDAVWGESFPFGGDDWNAVKLDTSHNLYF